jgi:hypothetical protein
VEAEEEQSIEQIDELATRNCTCDDAMDYQDKLQAIANTECDIDQLFGGQGTADILKSSIMPVAEGKVESVKVNIGNGVTATLKMNKKGRIQVQKQVTDVYTVEN